MSLRLQEVGRLQDDQLVVVGRGQRAARRQGGKDSKLTLPFFTIENVDVIDGDRIIVGNDNNLPFSSGRALGKSDDNELIILKVTDLLKAK